MELSNWNQEEKKSFPYWTYVQSLLAFLLIFHYICIRTNPSPPLGICNNWRNSMLNKLR